MAILHNPHTGRRTMLRTMHAFGRHPSSCLTVLQCPDVSIIHALARWNLGHWEILDQGRNGTFMDGVRLPRGEWVPLAAGCELSMGDCPDAQWQVDDLGPPINCLLPKDSGPPLALNPNGTFLPADMPPPLQQLHIHWHQGEWTAESLDGATTLRDGSTLMLDGRAWEVVLCGELNRTLDSQRLAAPATDIVLRFELSQNEEHARLLVRAGAEAIDLGERVHHYSLATLARLRLRDARRGVQARSQGWVSTADLARMLGVDPSYVNIQIFRGRQQFADALPPDLPAPMLIERRRGELRIGDYGFTVRRGAVDEGGLLRRPSGDLACV